MISLRRRPRRVVYKCLFGYSEAFLDMPLTGCDGMDLVCFTDDPTLRSDRWKIVQAPNPFLDPHRTSKSFKHRPHLFFGAYDESLYIDNTVEVVRPVNEIFALLAKSASPIMAFRHHERDCVYEEAATVVSYGYDDPALVDRQMDVYRRAGHPPKAGLNVTCFILRRHNEPRLMAAMNAWADQVLRYSKRDQLSFNVVMRHHALPVAELTGSVVDNALMRWPSPPHLSRLPRDFDDECYLAANPDVAAAGVNPRLHYLRHGIGEGRPCKPVA